MLDSGADVFIRRRNTRKPADSFVGERERGERNLPRENAAAECIDRECKQKRIREHRSVRMEDVQIKR